VRSDGATLPADLANKGVVKASPAARLVVVRINRLLDVVEFQ